MKPIEIAGGGLAGLALGIGLQRHGVPVTIFEAMRYPRHRVCGEFISGTSEETLERLGLADCLGGHLLHRSTAWFDGDGVMSRFVLPQPAIAISRYVLDERLAGCFRAAGGNLQEGTRYEWAEGKAGAIWCGGRKVVKGRSEWLGCKLHVRGLEMAAGLEMHLGRNGYVGLCQVEDGWINLCGLFRAEALPRVSKESLMPVLLELNGLGGLAERVRAAEWRPHSISGVAGFALGKQTATMASIGDAHSIIPPFTGNGMSMALQAAECALPHVIDYSAGCCEWDEAMARTLHDMDVRFRARLRWSGVFQRLLLSRLWQNPLKIFARAELLPFSPMYHFTRN